MENPEFEQKTFRILDSNPISAIEPIEQGGLTPQSREDLKKLVELPLLEACQKFFDKGIRTVFSSANKKDIEIGHAHIALDFESLSPQNKEIALSLGKEGIIHGSRIRKGIYLEIPVNEHSTIGQIKDEALSLVDKFEDQNT